MKQEEHFHVLKKINRIFIEYYVAFLHGIVCWIFAHFYTICTSLYIICNTVFISTDFNQKMSLVCFASTEIHICDRKTLKKIILAAVITISDTAI